MSPKTSKSLGHVAILGAGPVGLEAALRARELGAPFTVYEASDLAAGNVRAWGHVRLFSPWSMNASPLMREALARSGVSAPDGPDCPTGHELVEHVLDPVASLEGVAGSLRTGTTVVSVGREGLLKHEEIASRERAARRFRLLVRDGEGERVEHADLVLDCTGTYGCPNATGDGGIPAPGEAALSEQIARHLPDLSRCESAWAGRRVLLVGAGHSARTAARDLAALAHRRPGTRVVWAIRSPRPEWGIQPDDPLPERRRLSEEAAAIAEGASPAVSVLAGVVVDALRKTDGGIEVDLRTVAGAMETVGVDRVLSLTGYVGDQSIYRQLQVHECYASGAPMKLSAALLGDASGDCLVQTSHGVDTLRNPEPGFFILGSKSYGRNSTFLMGVGWDQVREVFTHLTGSE